MWLGVLAVLFALPFAQADASSPMAAAPTAITGSTMAPASGPMSVGNANSTAAAAPGKAGSDLARSSAPLLHGFALCVLVLYVT
jgi:hypothetical protein